MKANDEIEIFLDLDGVIADFDRASEYVALKFDRSKEADEFWGAMEHEYWSTIPVIEGAIEFYKKLKTIGKVRFLTGAICTEGCWSGKASWIMNKIGNGDKWLMQDLIICASFNKDLISKPGRILIDDTERNILAWRREGGTGILHTFGDFEGSLKMLDTVLKKD